MLYGKVKFFNAAKGFGFIVREDGGPDIFVHANDLGKGVVLTENARVGFDTQDGKRGPRATNVVLA